MDSCDDMLTHFYEVATEFVDYYLPKCPFKRHTSDKPWVNDKFRQLIRCRQYAYQTGDVVKYRRLRNAVQRLARQLRSRYYTRNVEQLRSSDPHKWWQNVKRFIGNKSSTHHPLSALANSDYSGDFQRLAADINNTFANISSDLTPLNNSYLQKLHEEDYNADFIIDPHEVHQKLTQIKVHKSAGPDAIPNWVLKEMAPFIAEPICAIFNASIRQGHVPFFWKQANVAPVPKIKIPKDLHSDLRPISLTPTLAKILESFVGHWMLDKIYDQIDSQQFGAVRGRSTTHALTSMLHLWSEALDRGDSVRVLFVDYTKAFDRMDHTILLDKLISFGIPNFIVKWIYSFLHQRDQRTKLNECFSDWITLNGGMPQGTWLGPLSFIAFINDLLPNCSSHHKFVDDVTLTEILGKNTCSAMNEITKDLIKWSQDNKMIINCNKTKEMILGKAKSDNMPHLQIDGKQIERVSEFKILGLQLSNTLCWDYNIESICKKISSKLYFLKLLKRAGLSTDDLQYFYTTVIRPISEYACTVWNHNLTSTLSDRLESHQKRALRIIYGDKIHGMTYVNILSLANLESLKDRRNKLSKSFFKKMLSADSCLHALLPPERNNEVLSRLRNPTKYPVPFTRTKRYQPFLNYALAHYQK